MFECKLQGSTIAKWLYLSLTPNGEFAILFARFSDILSQRDNLRHELRNLLSDPYHSLVWPRILE
jgi:hypothetical protein